MVGFALDRSGGKDWDGWVAMWVEVRMGYGDGSGCGLLLLLHLRIVGSHAAGKTGLNGIGRDDKGSISTDRTTRNRRPHIIPEVRRHRASASTLRLRRMPDEYAVCVSSMSRRAIRHRSDRHLLSDPAPS